MAGQRTVEFEMTENRHTRETIVQLLSNMSDGKEIRSYLNRFSEVDQSRFAVIKIGGAILRDELEDTAAALAFLHTVGLTPIVLHGGGPQLDERLTDAKIDTPKIDGLRVTNEAALDVARDVFFSENIKLVEAVRKQGVSAHSLTSGAIEANYLDKDKYGFVGDPVRVREDLLQSVVSSGAIPILTCLGMSPGGQLLNMNGDSATRALVGALQPMKIIFLSGVGGLLGEDGVTISSINLASDFDWLMEADWVHSGMRLKLKEISILLDAAPLSSSVSITTPRGLVRELFTHGGSGTLVRKGEAIAKLKAREEADKAKTIALVEEAFGRRLKSAWWDGLALESIIMSATYRAGAILSKLDGYAYLDKFAVVESARGEGLSKTVWQRMMQDHEKLFWRSQTENGFNAFYNDVCTGFVKRGHWTVYWCGDIDMTDIKPMVEKIAALPEAFED